MRAHELTLLVRSQGAVAFGSVLGNLIQSFASGKNNNNNNNNNDGGGEQ